MSKTETTWVLQMKNDCGNWITRNITGTVETLIEECLDIIADEDDETMTIESTRFMKVEITITPNKWVEYENDIKITKENLDIITLADAIKNRGEKTMKTIYSVQTRMNSWNDDLFNGTIEECRKYIKEDENLTTDNSRIALIEVDEYGVVINTIGYH